MIGDFPLPKRFGPSGGPAVLPGADPQPFSEGIVPSPA